MTLHASGTPVGLSFGEMGNSEVGHSNIGAGRVAYQTLPKISHSISDGSFRNEVLVEAFSRCKASKRHFYILVKFWKTKVFSPIAFDWHFI